MTLSDASVTSQCWPMLASYLWWDKLDYGGTQGLHTAVVIGIVKWTNTTVYLYKSENILHQLRFFPVYRIIGHFCNNQIFAFSATILTRENSICKNDMHCHLLLKTLKITKKWMLQRKKVTNLSHLHKILRQLKKPPWIYSTYYL